MPLRQSLDCGLIVSFHDEARVAEPLDVAHHHVDYYAIFVDPLHGTTWAKTVLNFKHRTARRFTISPLDLASWRASSLSSSSERNLAPASIKKK